MIAIAVSVGWFVLPTCTASPDFSRNIKAASTSSSARIRQTAGAKNGGAIAAGTDVVRYPTDASHHEAPPASYKDFMPTTPDSFVHSDVEGGKYQLIAWTKFLNKPEKIWASRIQLVATPGDAAPTMCWQSDDEELFQPEIVARPDWIYDKQPVFLVLRNAGAAVLLVEPIVVEDGKIVQLDKFTTEKLEIVKIPGQEHYELVMHDRERPDAQDKPTAYRWNGKTFTANTAVQEKGKQLR